MFINRWKGIFAYGLLGKIDKTVDVSQALWSKRHNRSIYEALDDILVKLSKIKYVDRETKLRNSRQFISSNLYLYLIGISLCMFTFIIECLIIFLTQIDWDKIRLNLKLFLSLCFSFFCLNLRCYRGLS